MQCHCSIYRKTAGGRGYAINVMADASSLEVTGTEALRVYQARLEDGSISASKRHFWSACASYLWAADGHWPDWIYPFAPSIDTALPKPPTPLSRSRIGTEAGVSISTADHPDIRRFP
jgi:hypothetical protein